MDLLKARLPLLVVITALGFAGGFGGTWAVAGAKQGETDRRVDDHERRIQIQEKNTQEVRERLIRIEILLEEMIKKGR